jgi:hypothetical protein
MAAVTSAVPRIDRTMLPSETTVSVIWDTSMLKLPSVARAVSLKFTTRASSTGEPKTDAKESEIRSSTM